MEILNQRDKISTKKFEITDKGVRISEKFFTSYFESLVSFEEITNKEIITTSNKGGWFLAFLIFTVCSFIVFIVGIVSHIHDLSATVFWFIISAICFLIYFFSQKRLRVIQGSNGTNLVFFNNKPDKKTLDDFIKSIFDFRKKFFLSKYTNSSIAPDERMRALSWLYEREIITLDELNKQKELLSNNGKVGFN